MLKLRKILVALSDPMGQRSLAGALRTRGLDAVFTSTLREARDVMGQEQVAVVFCQVQLEDGSFRDLLDSGESRRSKIPVVVCSPFYDKDVYIDAMCRGAFDFIAYPYAKKDVDWILSGALQSAAVAAGA
ncbi:MAG: hypothetical protein ACRD2B_09105 [Terriglobia bacterium]